MAKPASAIGSETDLLVCPYDKSHLILRKRFQVHLVRCRRSHPNADKVICPFNVTHRLNKAELAWHVSCCPDRQLFENFRHQDAPVKGLSSTINTTFCASDANTTTLCNTTTFHGGEYVESSESWDDLPDHPGYNPKAQVEKLEVLRLPVGLTPSERSAFRLAERKRLQALTKYN